MTGTDLSDLLKALAVPSRLQMVQMLRDRSYCVNALNRRLSISQPAVSQHLAVLRRVGLVDAVREGTTVHYRVNAARYDAVLAALAALGRESEAGKTA